MVTRVAETSPWPLPFGRTLAEAARLPEYSVIGEVTQSPAGNVVVVFGQVDLPDPAWYRAGHMVLTPEEARTFARLLLELAP